MRNYLTRLMINRFGRKYAYDVSYMLHMLETTPEVIAPYGQITKLSGYRKVVPVNAHGAAKIVGVLAEDCGPCVQISIDIAREMGMPDGQIRAVVTADIPAMEADTALAYRFATAVISPVADESDVREQVRDRWGDAGVIELTLACQLARIHPMVKAGLGYARNCVRVSVGDQTISPTREVALP